MQLISITINKHIEDYTKIWNSPNIFESHKNSANGPPIITN